MLKPEPGEEPELPPIDDRRQRARANDSDRRIRPRRRVLLTATLDTPAGERTVRMRNLSSTGTLLELEHAPPIGTLVTFRRGNTIAPGTVVWARPSSIGVQFLRPIHENEVLIHIRKPGAAF